MKKGNWTVQVQMSSRKQKMFNFGGNAWNHYLEICFDESYVDDDKVREVINASFYSQPVRGARYKKKEIGIDENSTWSYRYGQNTYYDNNFCGWRPNSWRKISLE